MDWIEQCYSISSILVQKNIISRFTLERVPGEILLFKQSSSKGVLPKHHRQTLAPHRSRSIPVNQIHGIVQIS